MKTLGAILVILAVTSIYGGIAHAQEEEKISGDTYTLPVYVQNKKGKPYRTTPVVVYLYGSEGFYNVPSNGLVHIPNVSDEDILHLFAGDKIFEIPVGGNDSINIVLNNARKLKSVQSFRNKEVFNTGYGIVSKEKNSHAYSNVEMMGAENYTSLIRFLEGRVAGLEVIGNTIRIRGVNSINSSTEPMVVVDGNMMTLGAAESSVSPRDIESITVDKTGSIYGVRGGNGVIIIKTRKGSKPTER